MADLQKNTEQKPAVEPKKKIQRGFLDLMIGLRDFFRELLELKVGLDDKRKTIRNIRDHKRVKGANA